MLTFFSLCLLFSNLIALNLVSPGDIDIFHSFYAKHFFGWIYPIGYNLIYI